MWAAVGEGTLALEITSGGMKKGAGEFGLGSGIMSRALEKLSEKEGAKNEVGQRAFAVIGDIYLNYPDFGSYLENGGAERILTILKAKSAQGKHGKDLMITFEELRNSETDKDQQARLEATQRNLPQKTSMQINMIATTMTVLKIENQSDFNGKLKFIKDAQGLGGGPAAMAGSSAAPIQVIS